MRKTATHRDAVNIPTTGLGTDPNGGYLVPTYLDNRIQSVLAGDRWAAPTLTNGWSMMPRLMSKVGSCAVLVVSG